MNYKKKLPRHSAVIDVLWHADGCNVLTLFINTFNMKKNMLSKLLALALLALAFGRTPRSTFNFA